MTSQATVGGADGQLSELIRSLSKEVRTGIFEGIIILALGLALLGWSLIARSADAARLAPLAAFWASLPVILLGTSYFARSYADSRVCLRLKAVRQALVASGALREEGQRTARRVTSSSTR